jgi:hypothetical protein
MYKVAAPSGVRVRAPLGSGVLPGRIPAFEELLGGFDDFLPYRARHRRIPLNADIQSVLPMILTLHAVASDRALKVQRPACKLRIRIARG